MASSSAGGAGRAAAGPGGTPPRRGLHQPGTPRAPGRLLSTLGSDLAEFQRLRADAGERRRSARGCFRALPRRRAEPSRVTAGPGGKRSRSGRRTSLPSPLGSDKAGLCQLRSRRSTPERGRSGRSRARNRPARMRQERRSEASATWQHPSLCGLRLVGTLQTGRRQRHGIQAKRSSRWSLPGWDAGAGSGLDADPGGARDRACARRCWRSSEVRMPTRRRLGGAAAG